MCTSPRVEMCKTKYYYYGLLNWVSLSLPQPQLDQLQTHQDCNCSLVQIGCGLVQFLVFFWF